MQTQFLNLDKVSSVKNKQTEISPAPSLALINCVEDSRALPAASLCTYPFLDILFNAPEWQELIITDWVIFIILHVCNVQEQHV